MVKKGNIRNRNRVDMRFRRVFGNEKVNYYHLTSKVINQEFVFDQKDKEFFRWLMHRLERFMGMRVLTYSIMPDFFHILLEVPEYGKLSDKELLERVKEYYSPVKMKGVYSEYEFLKQNNQDGQNKKRLDAWRKRLLDRMGNLSVFGKELKEQFSRWYNRRHGRMGTVWVSRFSSVLVENSKPALLTMAAYIDLAPVRAKLVEDPKDYRFSGYGEAIAGLESARQNLCVLARALNWDDAFALYRSYLLPESEEGINLEQIKEALELDQTLSLHEFLRCDVSCFSNGLAFGSETFIKKMLQIYFKNSKSKKKMESYRIKQLDIPFYCLKGLRRGLIRVPV